MADQVQTQAQESGGGEGVQVQSAPAPAVQDVKPVEAPQVQTEAKPEEPKPAQLEVVPESKPEVPAVPEVPAAPEVPAVPVAVPETKPEVAAEIKPAEQPKEETAAANDVVMAESNGEAKPSNDWQQREQQLLKKIEELEKVKNERSEDGLRLELKVREEEIDLLKARVRNLETELQAALSKPGGKNHEMIENIKQQHEELLSKARGMIFDKTKMVKNQELQIEALTTQVQSLKDINVITKDLLEIRNSEVKAMEDRFQAMEARFKAEKDRYGLVLQRAHTSTNLNEDLKKEYETQLAIFKELREKYELRVKALVAENTKLKEDAAKASGSKPT
ncbi:uncharacterized protein LOC142976671 isoform X2 [Anticarsia gemmatalis]|uniref:uncharacterized protein LOC142976671 isoform X2 n=1 Tax=Anticarsia gemmatalis TaxID=129554 RepID=UPI003F76B1F6